MYSEEWSLRFHEQLERVAGAVSPLSFHLPAHTDHAALLAALAALPDGAGVDAVARVFREFGGGGGPATYIGRPPAV